jgi:acid phosphatase (class A)
MCDRAIAFTAVLLACASVSIGAENVMLAPPGAGNAVALRFAPIEAFDFRTILPPPPEPGSLAAQADLETVRQLEVARTGDDIAWAKLVEKDNVFNHAGVLGAWFAAEKLPQTAAFFEELAGDLRALDGAAKKPFLRPRPTALDPGLRPCVALPASTSYPSGSAMQAIVWAELLADILPAKRDALLARAHRAGWGRVLGGVHFPTDIVGGHRLAQAYLTECRKSPKFRTAFAAVRSEVRAAAPAH